MKWKVNTILQRKENPPSEVSWWHLLEIPSHLFLQRMGVKLLGLLSYGEKTAMLKYQNPSIASR
jgi:hypothetical protein